MLGARAQGAPCCAAPEGQRLMCGCYLQACFYKMSHTNIMSEGNRKECQMWWIEFCIDFCGAYAHSVASNNSMTSADSSTLEKSKTVEFESASDPAACQQALAGMHDSPHVTITTLSVVDEQGLGRCQTGGEQCRQGTCLHSAIQAG